MAGKIFITRSAYDPQLGKHVRDPYLGPNPMLGACPGRAEGATTGRPHFRSLRQNPCRAQYVMGGFEIEAKIDALTAYQQPRETAAPAPGWPAYVVGRWGRKL